MNNGNEGFENLKEIESLKKEIALIREDNQIDMLNQIKRHADIVFKKDNRIKELEIINKEHQEINGKLQEEIKSIEQGTVNNFRRKGVL